jgi:cytochrome b involved in lipid metabolism
MSKLTKILVGISLFISWAIIIAILIVGLFFSSSVLRKQLVNNKNPSVSSSVILTSDEISKHNRANDCWVIVNNKVYDLTNFLSTHSGGSQAIYPYCGRDGSSAYATKDKNPARTHNPNDVNILDNYYIGDLNQAQNSGTKNNIVNSNNSSNTNSNIQTTTGGIDLTLDEVAKHNSNSDCWMVIDGKVYDVTKYTSSHPGGVSSIDMGCGRDATELYNTKGGGGNSHSSYARTLLNDFYIGDLNQKVTATQLQTTQNNINNVTIPNFRNGEDNERD